MNEVVTTKLGQWLWNEERVGLEFISNIVISEEERKQKERQKRLKQRNAKLGCSAGHSKPLRRIPRRAIKPTKLHSEVTLNDVKEVARSMLSEVEYVGPEFDGLFERPQLDSLLLLLLNYFEIFFEKRSIEDNPNPEHIDVSMKIKRYLEELTQKLENIFKEIGRAYALIVLGVDMGDEHHMNCGNSRVSNTYKDRTMYETFYSFCIFVVWIAFKRQDFDVIKKEINRMLRSDTFNPSLREKHFIENEEDCESQGDKILSPAEYRRSQGKRPSKMEVINQRSEAMISIIPLPKEESRYLFDRKKAIAAEELQREEEPIEQLGNEHKKFEIAPIKENVGIIGMPLKLFNLMTLTLLDEDQIEENEKSEAEVQSGRNEKQHKKHEKRQEKKNPSAQLSRATTGL